VISLKVSESSSCRSFVGFPWLIAFLTYTISWGWSLIRPNTLYWDDWAYIYDRPKSYLNEIFLKTGLPPWRALVDQELLGVGYWTIRWLTFIMFFATGLFLFEILKKIPFFSLAQRQSIVLLFLVFPLNHARVPLVMFGYTTSYFLFFLAWMILIKRSSWLSFLSACVCFMWSFMTHSFLIFTLLPILHFAYLHREQLICKKPSNKTLTQFILLIGSPVLYYVLRSLYWQPAPEYLWYHTVYLRAVLVALLFFLPFIVSSIGIVLWVRSGKRVSSKVLMITAGFLAFAVAAFPYLSSGNLDSRMTFFFWELDLSSRHQLLMPLGASAITVAIVYFISENKSKPVLALITAVMISLNVFWGIGTYVDSLKKVELEDLLSIELASDESSSFVFVDETRRFNFRESAYRLYEFAGHLSNAGKNPVPEVKYECEDGSNQTQVVISSDKGLIEAFFSQDLGLRIEIGPCKTS
jgi:hypothetical protein